jgi:hypothetical protein
MPQHFETKPTEPSGCTIESSVFSFSLHKVIVLGSNGPAQEDRLDLEGKINSPDELRSHKIRVELYKREEPQPPVIAGYEAIGRFWFMPDDFEEHVETGRTVPPGRFTTTIDVNCKIFDDLVNMLVALEGRDGFERELLLTIIGLLNNWDLEGYLPLIAFRLSGKSKPTIPKNQQGQDLPSVKLILPLVFHDEGTL